jgi:hypothetical protein
LNSEVIRCVYIIAGRCVCENGYYGVDCRYDIKVPPTIEDVEGGGLCDRRFGSECRCSEMQMDMLRDPFHCKRIVKIVSVNQLKK